MTMLKLSYLILTKLLSNNRTYPVLEAMTAILKEYPNSNFSIRRSH